MIGVIDMEVAEDMLEFFRFIVMLIVAVLTSLAFFVGCGVACHVIWRLFMFGWRWA